MVTHYHLDYNENPKMLASKVKATGMVTIRGRHTKAHQEQVNESTMFHLFSGEVLPLAQFIETYGSN